MTVYEIAREAGVSIGTVDRVLHNRGRVAPATERRIRAIVETAGYRANPLARHLKRNRRYPVALVIPALQSEGGYWRLIHQGILQGLEELSAFAFDLRLFEFRRGDRDSLRKAFRDLKKAGAEACILAPVMREETLEFLGEKQKTPDQGFPCFLVDSPLPGVSPVSTIAQNPFQGGFLAGKLMELYRPGGASFLVVRPYLDAFNLNERRRGFYAWFAGKPGRRILDLSCPEEPEDAAGEALGRVLATRQNWGGIFVVSSLGYRIAAHIEALGRKGEFTIIGYDLIEKNRECLLRGTMDCLITQRPEEQGRRVIHQVHRHLVLGEAPEAAIPIPLDVYFKENL
jgi:LacI family transcriptional regulator